ncbi:hypothetical protein [Microcystis sp. M42BS1]|uniref:phage major capsid protein n=1 Tax=Microcystis sp. M42BS1 TaxID=2771192 RepID=UPI0025849286|nr:hypothetical protein [Microcystis sp. M42BS1]MCA2570696.1 hypothetical protein [Microcystis sp. M42BS1]
MSGIITQSSFAKALWPGVNAWYGKAYNEYPVEWDKLFEKDTTNRAYVEDVGMTGLGLAAIKAEGAPIQYDSERQGFITRYTMVTYALGFIVTREAFDDDQYDVVAPRRAQGLAFSMRQTKELIGANVYNRAVTAGFVGGDGVTMFNRNHPAINGPVQSNMPAVDVDLSEAALEQAYIDISLLKNDRGLQISLVPQSIHIHPTYEFELARIMKSVGRVGTANNDINALKELNKFPKGMHINHYFTDLDAWYIRTNAPHGLKYFERRADSFDMDNDFDTENAKFKAAARYAFGWTDWRGIYGCMGA